MTQIEIAARDLLIKELREALIDSWSEEYMSGIDIRRRVEQALAKTEHHNSRALEKMLLEAELNGLSTPDFEFVERWTAVKVKLAELNKE